MPTLLETPATATSTDVSYKPVVMTGQKLPAETKPAFRSPLEMTRDEFEAKLNRLRSQRPGK